MAIPRKHLLPIVLGVCDGILNALTLVAGRLVHRDEPLSIGLSCRIAVAALASGAFVFFVARYSELRGELIHAEKELNLSAHGKLATSRLGRAVFVEATLSAALASGCAFVGSLLPLLAAVLLRRPFWLGVAFTILILGGLGFALARMVYGSRLKWSLSLMAAGVALSFIGIELHLL
jgi:predicted membrane protein (TIGR00267 family)